jgi:hypothetical protein
LFPEVKKAIRETVKSGLNKIADIQQEMGKHGEREEK